MPDKDAWSVCSTNLGFALDAINMCLSAGKKKHGMGIALN